MEQYFCIHLIRQIQTRSLCSPEEMRSPLSSKDTSPLTKERAYSLYSNILFLYRYSELMREAHTIKKNREQFQRMASLVFPDHRTLRQFLRTMDGCPGCSYSLGRDHKKVVAHPIKQNDLMEYLVKNDLYRRIDVLLQKVEFHPILNERNQGKVEEINNAITSFFQQYKRNVNAFALLSNVVILKSRIEWARAVYTLLIKADLVHESIQVIKNLMTLNGTEALMEALGTTMLDATMTHSYRTALYRIQKLALSIEFVPGSPNWTALIASHIESISRSEIKELLLKIIYLLVESHQLLLNWEVKNSKGIPILQNHLRMDILRLLTELAYIKCIRQCGKKDKIIVDRCLRSVMRMILGVTAKEFTTEVKYSMVRSLRGPIIDLFDQCTPPCKCLKGSFYQ